MREAVFNPVWEGHPRTTTPAKEPTAALLFSPLVAALLALIAARLKRGSRDDKPPAALSTSPSAHNR